MKRLPKIRPSSPGPAQCSPGIRGLDDIADGGQPRGPLTISGVDKTENTERDICASELSYRRLFEAARDGILILDFATGRIFDVNPFLVNLLGFSRSEIVGKTVGQVSPFHNLASNQAMWERLQQQGYVRYEDLPLETKDGRRIAVEFVSNVYQAGDKKVVQCNIRDIRARKQTEERLKASFKEINDLRSALDEHAIVAITDPQGKIAFVNDKFCAISKYARQELLGQDHRIVNSGHHPKEFMRDLWAAIRRGRVWHGEIKNKAKDGSFYWVATTIVPFLDAQGQPRQYVAIRTDITGRKVVEAKLLLLNAQLEQRVADRTAQLQAANREPEAFSDSVSHDLRAPLRHIDGFAHCLAKAAGPALPEKERHYLAEILDSVKQMGSLIDHLLHFSRAGRTELRLQPVDLARLVHEARNQFESESNGRDIRWKQGALLEVQGDEAMLRQVMLNLLSNALKYTRPRRPAEIEIGCDGSNPAETIVFVRDNGVGFDMAFADKLFGVFQRLHSSEEFEGTGIGLASVRRIIARHGGRTWAEGKVNAGATFYFSLPKINPPPDANGI
jgi:PAS domain S-box-containing protein